MDCLPIGVCFSKNLMGYTLYHGRKPWYNIRYFEKPRGEWE